MKLGRLFTPSSAASGESSDQSQSGAAMSKAAALEALLTAEGEAARGVVQSTLLPGVWAHSATTNFMEVTRSSTETAKVLPLADLLAALPNPAAKGFDSIHVTSSFVQQMKAEVAEAVLQTADSYLGSWAPTFTPSRMQSVLTGWVNPVKSVEYARKASEKPDKDYRFTLAAQSRISKEELTGVECTWGVELFYGGEAPRREAPRRLAPRPATGGVGGADSQLVAVACGEGDDGLDEAVPAVDPQAFNGEVSNVDVVAASGANM